MKDQYFADINDYRKYGLLRLLATEADLSLGICWMLTPPDGRSDGQFTAFWGAPRRWRHYDPLLFDALAGCQHASVQRAVSFARLWGLLPRATYFEELIPDPGAARRAYFERAWDTLRDCDLVFLDPDNGLEVKSVPVGRRDSSKYLYWPEVETGFSRGHSLLIYQHFQRKPRATFTAELARDLRIRTGAAAVYGFSTSHVLFLLATQRSHEPHLGRAAHAAAAQWGTQLRLSEHVVA